MTSAGFCRPRRRTTFRRRLFRAAVATWIGTALLAASSLPAAPIRLATYNVENYLVMDRRVDGKYHPEYPKPEREKAAVRQAIRAVDPDVLVLQEMGPAPFLEELREDLAREGSIYPYSHLLEAGDPDRHVAVLSRVPFTRVTPHPAVAFTYFGERTVVKRGLLEIELGSGAQSWTLFVLHLKSRYTDREDDPSSARRRLAEARALRDLILRHFPDPAGARFVVTGDFNDTRDSRPLAAFFHRGRTVITRPVPATDGRGETWTYYYARADSYSRVDYILVSPGLWPAVKQGRAFIHDDPAAAAGSDHRMVFVDLDLDPAREAKASGLAPSAYRANHDKDPAAGAPAPPRRSGVRER